MLGKAHLKYVIIFLLFSTSYDLGIGHGYSVSACKSQEKKVEKHDFTVVTAFLDIGRGDWANFKRPLETYFEFSRPLLSLNIPLVIYVSDHVRPYIEEIRRGKENITHVISVDIQNLELYQYYDDMKAVLESESFQDENPVLSHPESFSVEYNILVNSKPYFMKKAVERNIFQTSYFYWLDFGYGHGSDIYPESCEWAPYNIMDKSDKITYISLSNIYAIHSIFDIYKQKIGPPVNGGFFGGTAKAIQSYYYLHKESFQELLTENIVDDDQALVVVCFIKRPSLFRFVRAGWYDVFSIFQ